jgi:hypothetical protein
LHGQPESSEQLGLRQQETFVPAGEKDRCYP